MNILLKSLTDLSGLTIKTFCLRVAPSSADKMSLQFKTDCLMSGDMPDASFRSIIELWPSRESMATDIGGNAAAVSKWWQRDSIPAEWWASVLGTAFATEAGLTAEVLTAMAAREPAELRA